MGDDLERRLRDVLRGPHLDIDAANDALERVHVGAARRQHRRLAAAGSVGVAAVAVVAVIVSGVVINSRHSAVTAEKNPRPAAPSTSSETPSQRLAAPPVEPTADATVAASKALSASAAPNKGALLETPAIAAGFQPVSVTAISQNTYWVLGYTSGKESGGHIVGHAEVMKTTDGGEHFSQAGNLDVLAADALVDQPLGQPVVTDIRFGDASNGWAYGGSLYMTADGGGSWSPVNGVPGAVVDVVATNNVAWAVVDLSLAPGSPPPTARHRFAIYSTPYGISPQHWRPVDLPLGDLGAAQPSIVDQDGTVTLMVAGPLRNGYHEHVLVAKPGGAFVDHEAPCLQDTGGFLSNSKKAIWAVCQIGSSGNLFVSTDRGATWRPPKGPLNFPDPPALGAVDDQYAIVTNYATGALLRVGVDGSRDQANAPTQGTIGASFIGFTTEDTGFAIVHQEVGGTTYLLRTTDGGLTWSIVGFGA